jgi:hypothetical protein
VVLTKECSKLFAIYDTIHALYFQYHAQVPKWLFAGSDGLPREKAFRKRALGSRDIAPLVDRRLMDACLS